MIALLAGIVVASLAGSVHCVAMCGPLVGLHGGGLRLAAAHAVGRLVTYAMLGVAAGLAGSAIDLAGKLGNVQHVAAVVAGLVIVVWGIAQASGLRPQASARSSTFGNALVRIRAKQPGRRAWWTGVLTGLIPCGWLWAFVVSAAGTGSAVVGGLVMIAFWLGTVPAMIGVLGVAGPLIARLRARVPVVTAIALVAVGLGTLALRWRDTGATQVTHPHCHHVS